MTKHQGGQSHLAPPALGSYLGAHYDPQLDSGSKSHLPNSGTPYYWPHHHPSNHHHPTQLFAQQPPRLDTPAARDHLISGRPSVHMDKLIAPGPAGDRRPQGSSSSYQAPQLASSQEVECNNDRDSWDSDQRDNKKNSSSAGRKKNYQRYPKPPYSYLAMIAMVIQNSPEKKLTLSEILKEISTLFPFFKGNYKGWRDSVRHNLSSYDCFVKVLKDPGKPQGKGNFWSVELSRVPLELLKRQNTAVARQEETVFAQDLAPYILHGQTLKPEAEALPVTATALPPLTPRDSSPPQDDLFRPKLDSSFAIDSLLHSLRPASAAGEAERATRDFWGSVLPPRLSPPQRYTPSTCSTSASSASPASSSSDEDWRGLPRSGKRMPPYGEAGSDGYEDCRPPLHKAARRNSAAPPWELPTSYAKYTPPNAVAPPSMRFNGGPLVPLHGGIPLYSYGGTPVVPGRFLSHAYWPILPSGRVSLQAPPLIMDLDSMLQSVPPNKSVFDALVPAPHHQSHQNSHHQPHYALQTASPLNRYPHY